jgi:hypothetical protein
MSAEKTILGNVMWSPPLPSPSPIPGNLRQGMGGSWGRKWKIIALFIGKKEQEEWFHY